MRKLLFLSIIFLSLQGSAKAEELYAVENPDGSVVIVNYQGGSNDSLNDVLRDFGLTGLPITGIKRSDIPVDRSDRKFWKLTGKSIAVDSVKKQDFENEKALKEQEKEAVLSKLKISKEEFEKLNV